MPSGTKRSRRYGGVGGDERRAERRLLLIDAAIRVYGDVGYRDATVKAICAAAGLTERYFYESFANSEALLIAAYTHVTDGLHAEMSRAGARFTDDAAGRTVAVLTLYFTQLRANPRAARVFLLEIAGISPAVELVRAKAVRALSDVLTPGSGDSLRSKRGGSDGLVPTGMIGAVLGIAWRWVSHNYSHPVGDVVAAAAMFCRVASPQAANTDDRRSDTTRKLRRQSQG